MIEKHKMRRRRRGHARGGWRRKTIPRVPKVWTCRRCGCRGAPKFFGRKVNNFAWCIKCNQNKNNNNNNKFHNNKKKNHHNYKNNNNKSNDRLTEELKEFLLAIFSLIIESNGESINMEDLKIAIEQLIDNNKGNNKNNNSEKFEHTMYSCNVCVEDFKPEMMVNKKVCRSCIKNASWCESCKIYLHNTSFSKTQLAKKNSNCLGCVEKKLEERDRKKKEQEENKKKLQRYQYDSKKRTMDILTKHLDDLKELRNHNIEAEEEEGYDKEDKLKQDPPLPKNQGTNKKEKSNKKDLATINLLITFQIQKKKKKEIPNPLPRINSIRIKGSNAQDLLTGLHLISHLNTID